MISLEGKQKSTRIFALLAISFFCLLVMGQLSPILASHEAEISGVVFSDINNNGKFDAGDKPLKGVKVNLRCTLSDGTKAAEDIRTDDNGKYSFKIEIPRGLTADCKVRVKVSQSALDGRVPCDPSLVSDGTLRIEVNGLERGDKVNDVDICFREPPQQPGKITIGDQVFCDINDNGRFDRGDLPLADIKVRLKCEFSDGTVIRDDVRTDANGQYMFMFEVDRGVTVDCRLTVKNTQRGLEDKEPCPGTDIASNNKSRIRVNDLEAGDEFLDADFCFRFPSAPGKVTIGDQVFCDINDNGRFDAGDEPLEGIEVALKCDLSDGTSVTDVTRTDANGEYMFMFNVQPDVTAVCDVTVNTSQPGLDGKVPCCPEDLGGSPACEKGRKPIALTFEYTGEGCAGSDNNQGKKSDCSGGTAGVEPVTITVNGKKNGGRTFTNVLIGDVITILASDVDKKDKFPSKITVEISTGETNEIHTSCSAPLATGDQFGSLRLRALFLEGDEITDGDGADLPICERATVEGNRYAITIDELEDGDIDLDADFCFRFDVADEACEKGKKPTELTFRYTGEGCAGSDNNQGKKSECSGGAVGVEPVTIVVSKDKKKKKDDITFNNVFIGDLITISASDLDKKGKFPSKIFVRNTTTGEDNEIHTSCSAPLATGDQFGSFLLTKLVLRDKGSIPAGSADDDLTLSKASGKIPNDFGLMQNYPNPFNPETEIHFQLPQASNVVLKIYNTLGQEIVTLANGRYAAGAYDVRWNGRDSYGNSVPSGLYIYKLEAGEFSQAMKMTLLK